MRVNLTDRRIAALQPDPAGKRRPELRDAIVPGLIVRVAARRKTFMLHTRFPGSSQPTRRAIGEYGAVTIDGARTIARQWLELIKKGVDPQEEVRRREDEARRARQQQALRDDCRLTAVVEDYLKRRVARQRRAVAVERILRNELIPVWGDRPIAEITRRDVIRLVEQINDRPAPIYAAHVFNCARTMFSWAIGRGTYGLDEEAPSPFDRIKVAEFVSRRKEPRQRTLDDAELVAFWKATRRLPYPWGALFRLLLLTGTRKTEASGARWREFDFERKVWTIPPERFKSNAPHLVPLTADVLALLGDLPRFQRGDHLFSVTFGEGPVRTLHDVKVRLDALMTGYLRALARLRGEDPAEVTLTPWRTHDLRRTVRTRLAGLEVDDTVAEMILGHAHRGVQRIYDQHSRLEPRRRALEAWATELRRIVTKEEPSSNVVPLRAGEG